jgi:hypothetical protein
MIRHEIENQVVTHPTFREILAGVINDAIRADRPDQVHGLLARQILELVWSRFVGQKFVTFVARLNQHDLTILGELMEAGKVTPVIDINIFCPR